MNRRFQNFRNKDYQNKLVVFLHIPKTAGTTLRSIFMKQYQGQELLLCYNNAKKWRMELKNPAKLRHVKAIAGHFPFGIHRSIPRKFTYITMLRDPVERVVSLYQHFQRDPNQRYHQKVKQMSLKEFVNCEEIMNVRIGSTAHINNPQTRFLSGDKTANLEKAIDNLTKNFSVVGVTDLFDESIFLMKKKLSWRNIHYRKLNVSKKRTKKEDLPKEILDLIEEKNKLDIQLYHHFKQELQKKIRALDAVSLQELNALKGKK